MSGGQNEERLKMLKEKLKMLDLIAFYLKNLKLDFDLASEVILEIAKEHQLPTEHVARVVDRFESDCLVQSVGRLAKDRSRKNKQIRWGAVLPFRHALNFLSKPTDMLKLVLLNKETADKLLPKMHSIVLSRPISDDKFRLAVWSAVLKEKDCPFDFAGIYRAEIKLDNTLEGVIEMDVVRSFSHDKTFPRESLKQILRCGAVAMHEGAGYCQGMNYLAGALLYLAKNEPRVFRLYVSLIEKRMDELFSHKFEKLKCYFYVLDSLIAIFIPDLSEHFKVVLKENGSPCSLLL